MSDEWFDQQFNLALIDNSIIAEVQAEMERQIELWGVQTHHPIKWQAILTEEVGEVAKAVVESWEQGNAPDEEKYRTELIQCAAVAISALRSLKLNKLPDDERERLCSHVNGHAAKKTNDYEREGKPAFGPERAENALNRMAEYGAPKPSIAPTFYGEAKMIDPALGVLMISQLANSRLLNAAEEAVRLVMAQHPNVRIAPPFAFPGNRLAFTAVRQNSDGGYDGLQGQEDFTRELRTCKDDTELVFAIAKRIESQMELPPIIGR